MRRGSTTLGSSRRRRNSVGSSTPSSALADELGLPVVVHTRDADADTAAALAGFAGTVVMHCFSSPGLLPAALERGYYVSFAGNATYPKASELRRGRDGRAPRAGSSWRRTARISPRNPSEAAGTSRRTSSTRSLPSLQVSWRRRRDELAARHARQRRRRLRALT